MLASQVRCESLSEWGIVMLSLQIPTYRAGYAWDFRRRRETFAFGVFRFFRGRRLRSGSGGGEASGSVPIGCDSVGRTVASQAFGLGVSPRTMYLPVVVSNPSKKTGSHRWNPIETGKEDAGCSASSAEPSYGLVAMPERRGRFALDVDGRRLIVEEVTN